MKFAWKKIICLLLVAVLSFLAGFSVMGGFSDKSEVPTVVGTYRTNDWNGDETVVLVLNKDGSCRYPTGRIGTWTQEGDQIIMDFGEKVDSGSSGGVTISPGVSNIKTCTVIGNVDGIILNDFFFEKIS